MLKQTKNKVARILKIYSIINAIVVFLASIILTLNEGEIIFFIVGTALAVCVNFFIYAFGELLDLLAQIRDNTKAAGATGIEATYDDLPDL